MLRRIRGAVSRIGARLGPKATILLYHRIAEGATSKRYARSAAP
jgi:hypothetical protein